MKLLDPSWDVTAKAQETSQEILWRNASKHSFGVGLETGIPSLEPARKAKRYFKKQGRHDAAQGLENIVVGIYRPYANEGVYGVCPRCAKDVTLGREHDIYHCDDNKNIEHAYFKFATERVSRQRAAIDCKSCFWMRGILPRCMSKQVEGPTIAQARIWESEGFTEVINRSRIGYSDGTGGQDDIAKSIRPTAFGIATFDFLEVNGTLQAQNIQIIGGETPGRQTVPRSELWGAIVVIGKVHINVCARIGIDASYVTDGACNRLRLEK